MGPALFAITLEAMKSEVDEVALQGKHKTNYLKSYVKKNFKK